MRSLEFVRSLMLCLGFLGCAETQPTQRTDAPISRPPPASPAPPSPAAAGGGTVQVDSRQPPILQAAWLGFALGIAKARIDTAKAKQPPDLFAEAVAGVRLLVGAWAELPDKPLRDPQLELLTRVVEAGFVEEYALQFLSAPGWRIKTEKLATLKLTAFASFRQQNLAEHQFVSHAGIRFASRTPIFGEDLGPRIPKFQPPHCGNALDQMKLVIAQLEARRPPTADRLLSSASREQFMQALTWLQTPEKNADAATAPGIQWIAPEVSDLYITAAFCAIEGQQVPLAEMYLRKVLQYNPAHANGYAELAHVLLLQRRFDEALVQIGEGLRRTEDPCVQAMLLRKRGYILIEQEQLGAARSAYMASLELAPGNPLALSELQVIEENMRRRGLPKDTGSTDKGFAPGASPATTILSTCQKK